MRRADAVTPNSSPASRMPLHQRREPGQRTERLLDRFRPAAVADLVPVRAPEPGDPAAGPERERRGEQERGPPVAELAAQPCPEAVKHTPTLVRCHGRVEDQPDLRVD